MTKKAFFKNLLGFLGESTSPWHAVQAAAKRLEQAGFQYCEDRSDWQGGKGRFYTTRNNSSIIAWNAPDDNPTKGVRIIGSHTDSPCLRVKPNALTERKGVWSVGVEPYGGVLQHPWFDRDLSLSGRVVTADGTEHIVDLQKPIAIIPSLAIHLNGSVNRESAINAQLHLPPTLGKAVDTKIGFNDLLKDAFKLKEDIIDFELGLYDTNQPAIIGWKQDMIASARLDNLLSLYCSIDAITNARPSQWSMLVSTDHEEIGSSSHCGAAGPFLVDTLNRLVDGRVLNFQQVVARSLLISADNAHAVHPNYADKHEPNHQPQLNDGVVIKVNHNQRYATNAVTSSYFKALCKRLKIPFNTMVVRSDMGCGSTIGPITSTLTGLNTIDVGIPQWAMHSIRETAGCDDIWSMRKAMLGFMEEESLL